MLPRTNFHNESNRSDRRMIMIVDDNVPIRAMIKHFIQSISADEEFYECNDGSEAIDAYERLRPKWVLMDIKMPGMDGLAATETIRSQFPEAQIIIITNFDDPELHDAARKAGAAGYVLKDNLTDLRRAMGIS